MSKIQEYQPEAMLGEVGRLSVTKTALAHLQRQAQKQKPMGKALRIDMKKAGCSGSKYIFDYVEAPQPGDEVIVLNPEFSIFVAKDVWLKIQGSTIDYVQEGVNGRLKLMNPNETGACGCGESVYFG